VNHIKQPIRIETALFLRRLRRYLPEAAASLQTRARPCRQVLLALSFFVCCQSAQAVNPAPDGGYPGFNTAEGQNALFSNTTGAYNTGLGLFSLRSNTEGSFNTATGAGTLLLNTAGNNTADGAAALLFNTDGSDNTGIGAFALLNNTATGNTAVGSGALVNNTTGGTMGNIQGYDVGPNVAVGWQALENNTVAGANTALGYQALHSFITGPVTLEQLGLCTAIGFQALGNATGGPGNSGFGYQTLFNNTEGSGNTAIGPQALFNNTTGNSNIAIGVSALFNNTIGRWNVANGGSALISNVTGESNVAIGQQAMQSNISGSDNTAVGFEALVDNTNGSHNIALGDGAGVNVVTADRVICIGAVGEDISNSCYIGQIFNATCIGGSGVFIDANNKLGTITSSRRFKDEIKPMEQASEILFALKPVTFQYKKEIDPKGISQFGLVAEEVQKVNPDLVVRDKEGKAYSVRYDQVNAMLLNEFLKEHKKVQQLEVAVAHQRNDLQATIAELKKEMDNFAARYKTQDAKIQRMKAHLELNTSAPKKIANK
jgi:hypothetical protein